MIDIFGSFEATLLAYYLGVLLVLTVGMQGVAILDRVTAKFFVHEDDGAEAYPEESTHQAEIAVVTPIDPEEPSDLEEIAISVNLTDNVFNRFDESEKTEESDPLDSDNLKSNQ